jgi:O-antigen/teichoic acid export membrane protein
MRTKNSVRNILIGMASQIIIAILGFVSRKIFLDSLGIEYLGVNGLLTNLLSMMALVESGIGISIVYNLYKPLAESDRYKVVALVQLYKKAYGILAIIIFLFSLFLYPFLDTIMKETRTVSNITIIYFLFVAKNMLSYLNAHKWSLINADQKGYVIAKVELIFQVLTTIVKIIVLILTRNFILYLLIEFILYAIQIIYSSKIVEKRYPYIKTKEKYEIDKSTKENLITNVKAMILHNIGGYLVFGTDNILISSFISVATVGLYSNYTMIMQQLSGLAKPILGGIGASVGNLIATESNEKNYSVFKMTFLINFWIFSIGVIFLYNLLEPFINWWLGNGYLLGEITFIIILINFYLDGMRIAISTFKNKAGLFVQDKYFPLIEGGINLVSSLILVKIFGLAGIFIGTTISTVTTVFWTQPTIVYKNLFKKSVSSYFVKYCLYAVLTILTCYLTTSVSDLLVVGEGFKSLVAKGIICLTLPNILYTIIFYRSKDFQLLKNTIKSALIPFIKNKLKSAS